MRDGCWPMWTRPRCESLLNQMWDCTCTVDVRELRHAQNENEKLKKKVKEAEGEYNKIKNDNVAYHYIANVLEQNDHDSLEHMKRTHTVEQIINIQVLLLSQCTRLPGCSRLAVRACCSSSRLMWGQAKTLTWRTKQYTNLSKQVSELKYQQVTAVLTSNCASTMTSCMHCRSVQCLRQSARCVYADLL